MKTYEAFAAQDGIDYSMWLDFIHEDIEDMSLPVLTQMQRDLADEISRRRISDIIEIEQGMKDVVRPVLEFSDEPF